MTKLRRIGFRWDRQQHLLWACAETTDGRVYKIGFPLAAIELLFCEEAEKEGITTGPRVGGNPTTDAFCGWVDGLGRRYDGEAVGACSPPIVGAAELIRDDDVLENEVGKFRLGRRIKRAFRKATKRVARKAAGFLRRAGRIGKRIVRSQALGWAVRGAAKAMPAIGGPALAALTAARSAAGMVDRAKKIAQSTQRGVRALSRGNVQQAMAQARRVEHQVRSLQHQATPQAKMLRSALQSIRM